MEIFIQGIGLLDLEESRLSLIHLFYMETDTLKWRIPNYLVVFRKTFTMLMKRYCHSEKIMKIDRKSTRLNSSHVSISYAVFCLKKKNNNQTPHMHTSAVSISEIK